jgi:hypothetical protein
MATDQDVINTNLRGLPIWVRDELEAASRETFRGSVNNQILAVLTEWARKRKTEKEEADGQK